MLFVVYRVTSPADRSELFEQMRQRHDCSWRNRPHRMHPRNLLHLFTTQMTNQRFSNCRRLRCYTPSVPDVHLDETRRFDSLDVNGISMIEDREMRTQTGGLRNLPEVRHGEFAQGHSLHRLSAETQHSYSERVLPGLNIAPHVTTAHQRPQQVARRTLRHFSRPADFGRAQPVIPARQEFENGQRAFNRSDLLPTRRTPFYRVLISCNCCSRHAALRSRQDSPAKIPFTIPNYP